MGDVVFISSTESANSPRFGSVSSISLVQVLQTCYSLTQIQPRYLWKKPFLSRAQASPEQTNKGKQIKDYMRGRQRVNSCYARLLEARSGRGQKTTSRSSVFTGSAFPPRGSARTPFPYLICLRPSPSLYAFWFLVGASWSQPRQWVCVTDPKVSMAGVPLPAPRLPARLWN